MGDADSGVTDGVTLAGVVDRIKRTRLPEASRRKQIRETAGVTIREMAALAGVSPMTVCRWERGTTPAPDLAAKYREVLDALEAAVA